MPVHLPAQNRRQFLFTLGAGFVTCSSGLLAKEQSDQQSDIVYILNDTHIGEKHPANSPIPTHLREIVGELVELPQKPACVLINGDLALRDGQPGDYKHFARLIQPLQEARIDTHLTLGNHDERDVFYEVMQEQRPAALPVNTTECTAVPLISNFNVPESASPKEFAT